MSEEGKIEAIRSEHNLPMFTKQWGPAAILTLLQIIVVVGGGVWGTATMFRKSDEHSDKLIAIAGKVEKIETTQERNAGTFAAAQTAITYLTENVKTLEIRLAAIQSQIFSRPRNND